ncbi:hypothetical protein ONS95_009853 [Cadophora gregata]|uniref:uncharacterized protein n=1 Tax=Cadophora gregata TaxID=51156 RepID=UPI0026DCDE6C|nr:uncharacterized protein ONS95_009853 [Cadophora gregata]KAK0121563.1 hypothetical protein ONS95_009853 [Cadophora gregata]
MTPPPISLIEDLCDNDIKKLTQLLILSPMTATDPVWLQEQSKSIDTLPPKLKRPESFLPRLAMSLPFGKEKAHLCLSHKPLNPHLIRRIFLQVSAECTTRIARLVSNQYLPPDIAVHVKTLQKVNSLWMSADLYRCTFQCQPHEERFDRIASDCEACILAAVGGNISILQDLRASMIGRKKKRGTPPRLLPLVESWIMCTGAEAMVREQSDNLAVEIRNCRRQMQEARRQKRRNEKEGILDPPPPEMSSTTPRAVEDPFADVMHLIGVPFSNQNKAAQDFNNPFADPEHGYGRFQGKESYEYEDRDEHEHEIEHEGSIINFYAHRLSSANLHNNQNITQAQNEAKIHPAFKDSMVFQFQTNPSAYSLPAHNPFEDDDDQAANTLPPRPGNPTAYDDPEFNSNGGSGPTHRGASSRPRQPPPLAYLNRANVKQMKNSWKRVTGYSESVYSRPVDEYESFAQLDSAARPPVPQRNVRRVEGSGDISAGFSKLAQGGRIEEEGGYLPPRREWKGGEEGKGSGGWNGRDGDGDERGKRDTNFTSFGDFI